MTKQVKKIHRNICRLSHRGGKKPWEVGCLSYPDRSLPSLVNIALGTREYKKR